MILGIETSGTTGGAALFDGRRLLGSLSFTSATLYSQRLLPSVEWLLCRAGVAPGAIGAVAVSIGPGSFTGLRIGLAAAKALAYANHGRIVGVNTLEAMVLRAAPGTAAGMPVCPVIDARQGEIYAALFAAHAPEVAEDGIAGMPRLERLREDRAGSLEFLAEWIVTPTLFVGEGAVRYHERLRDLLGPNLVMAPGIRMLPSAEEVAWIGFEKLHCGTGDDLALLEPHYLRKSYARPA